MSMLSSQCDKLRKRAEMVDGLSPSLASELRMAADTIWELRDETSRLRAQLDEDEHELSMAADREVHATRREAKLRELVRISIVYCNSGVCDGCPIQGGEGQCPYAEVARELGVEVEG